MAELQIDKLIRGVATGKYDRELGSQFGSIWGFDGLVEAEATLEQYAAFRGSSRLNLGLGKPIAWMDQEWSVILVYNPSQLAQVNVQTAANDANFDVVCSWVESPLGKGRSVEMPQDHPQSVLRRLIWNGRDGAVCAVRTPEFVQVSVGRYTRARRIAERAARFIGLR